jgi:hypothetical protein
MKFLCEYYLPGFEFDQQIFSHPLQILFAAERLEADHIKEF